MIPVRCETLSLDMKLDGFSLYQRLAAYFGDRPLFLLESLAGPDVDCRRTMVGINPLITLTVSQGKVSLSGEVALLDALTPVFADSAFLLSDTTPYCYTLKTKTHIWDVLRALEAAFQVDDEGPFCGIGLGFFGYCGYDTIHYIETLPYSIPKHDDLSDMVFSLYQSIIHVDLAKETSSLIVNHSPYFPAFSLQTLKTLALEKTPVVSSDILRAAVPPVEQMQDSVDKSQYLTWVERALEHIAVGDIYQIQLGHELRLKTAISPWQVYERLRAINPSPYMYYAQFQQTKIIGASPEVFLRIQKDSVEMRPIAGTIRRGKTAEEDKQLEKQLLADEKERAEHLMLVDLARNDIGRICEVNTLEVNELMAIEAYSHVSHLVSNVKGKLAANYDKYDALAATFPAGTMTGAPKIEAMTLIEAMETSRRGIYAGCLGYIDFSGTVETALCIRTACYEAGEYRIRASGGVVADSTPEAEWQETINKLSATYFAITGEELKYADIID